MADGEATEGWMAFDDKGSTASDEISLFDIADWLWAFRWLAISLFILASIWTGIIFWTGRQAAPVKTSFAVTTTIYPSGTPVRNASEIAGILRSRLEANGLLVTSALGANPVMADAPTAEAAQTVIATAQTLAEDLEADVQAQMNILAPFMRNENVPDYIAAQYVKNVSFLEGQTGLIRLLDPLVKESASGPAGQSRIQLLVPWLLCGLAFLAIAGGVSFNRAWKAHRSRKLALAGRDD